MKTERGHLSPNFCFRLRLNEFMLFSQFDFSSQNRSQFNDINIFNNLKRFFDAETTSKPVNWDPLFSCRKLYPVAMKSR